MCNLVAPNARGTIDHQQIMIPTHKKSCRQLAYLSIKPFIKFMG
jgi:hypothetical protein